MSKLVARLPALASGAVEFSRPRLATFLRYAKVEFKPPVGEIPEIGARIGQIVHSAQTGKWMKLSVKEATINTMVCLEVLILFYVGEIIGKGTLIGYDVSRVKPAFPFAI